MFLQTSAFISQLNRKIKIEVPLIVANTVPTPKLSFEGIRDVAPSRLTIPFKTGSY